MHALIEMAAQELGFARVYFLPMEPLIRWQREVLKPDQDETACTLISEPLVSCPWASCILLLIYAYLPFAAGERIPAYYLASQKAYLAAGTLCERIRQAGFHAERVHVPARALALQSGIGTAGKNGLLYLPEFGSRFAIQTLATDACPPLPVMQKGRGNSACRSCGACARACPACAIDEEHGLHPVKCMRYHMKKAPFPEWVEKIMPGYLGCEICQSICPLNAHLPIAEPDAAAREAFEPKRLISGDAAQARRITGKNLSGGGKLSYQAEIFQKREKQAEK